MPSVILIQLMTCRANDICSSIVLLQIIISCQDQNKIVLNILNTHIKPTITIN